MRTLPTTKHQNVLLVEDDRDQAILVGRWLSEDVTLRVTTVTSAEMALIELRKTDFALMVADIGLPGINGIELVQRAKRLRPYMVSIVVTAHQRLDYAIAALQSRADDFVLKPLRRNILRAKVTSLLERSVVMRNSRRTVLAIGAHPDDVEIGCGGILLRHVAMGDQVTILTLSSGESGGKFAERTLESQRAARMIGATLVAMTLEDTKISSGNGTIELISSVIHEARPDTVYTHGIHDTHQDHRSTHQATMVASRDVPNVLCYQSPSSTTRFSPRLFVDIGDFLAKKIEVIAMYKSQTVKCAYLNPTLLDATACYWGRFAGNRYVEPLEVKRSIDCRKSIYSASGDTSLYPISSDTNCTRAK